MKCESCKNWILNADGVHYCAVLDMEVDEYAATIQCDDYEPYVREESNENI